MGNFSIERSKNKLTDVKSNLDIKKKELKNLEENKIKLLEIGSELQDSDIDTDAQRKLMEYINNSLDYNAQKGEELSEEMQSDFSSIENMKQEVDSSMENNKKEEDKLYHTKTLLDKIGLGKNIDYALSELKDNKKDLDELNSNLIDTEKELSNISQKLSML